MGWLDDVSTVSEGAPAKEKKTPDNSWLDSVSEPADDSKYDISEYSSPTKASEGKAGRFARLYGESAKDAVKSGVVDAAAKGIGETVLSGVTGAASSAVGGLAGAARTGYRLARGDTLQDAAEKGTETIRDVQKAGTYQPRSAQGQLIGELMGAGVDVAKEATGVIAKDVGKGVGAGVGYALGGKEGATTGAEKGGAIGESIGEAAPEVAMTLAGAPFKANKAAVPVAGKDYSPLRTLTAEQSERMQRQRDLGVSPTLGSVTRSPEQVRFEEQTALGKEGGEALRQRNLENNAALVTALEETDKKRAGQKTSENERDTGISVADALEKKAKASMSNVDMLYKQARDSGETKARVRTKALEDFFDENRSQGVAVPAISALESKYQALKKESGGKLTIDDMEALYQSANQLRNSNPAAAHFMGVAKSRINDITQGVGGDLYRQARAARLEHGMEFEDRAAIADIIAKKTRTDYRTASEDIFHKLVVNGSLDELRDVTTSLLSVSPKKEPGAWQAVRNMQGQAIDYLVERSTKGIGLDEKGNPVFSPAEFRNGVKAIGREKLNHLLGEDAVDRLYDILQTSRELKTSSGRVSGSDTAINLKDAAAKEVAKVAATHLFGMAGRAANFAGSLIGKSAEQKALKGRVEESLNPSAAPAKEVQEISKLERKKNRQYGLWSNARKATPAAAVGEVQAEEQQE